MGTIIDTIGFCFKTLAYIARNLYAPVPIFFFLIFIYLVAALGLSCGIQDL